MHKIASKVRHIEKILDINGYLVKIVRLHCEPEDEALIRHLKANPGDAGKEYHFTSRYPTHEDFISNRHEWDPEWKGY